MTVTDLMTQEVTLRKFAGESRDSIGGSTPLFDELETTMYLEPVDIGSFEYHDNRDAPVGAWLGVGRAEIDWGSWDEVVYGEHILKMDAPPRVIHNPRLRAASHVEMDFKEYQNDQGPGSS